MLCRNFLEFCILTSIKYSLKNKYILDHLNDDLITVIKFHCLCCRCLYDHVGIQSYDFECHELIKNEQKWILCNDAFYSCEDQMLEQQIV